VTQEDGARGLVGLEEAPDGDPERVRSLIWRRRQARQSRGASCGRKRRRCPRQDQRWQPPP
jgi:hypothetical protein